MPGREEELYQSILQLKYISLGIVVLMVIVAASLLIVEVNSESFEKSARYKPPVENSDESEANVADEELAEQTSALRGQTVYVPAYSHIYHRDGEPILLTITLSIRNTSLIESVRVDSVVYYDTAGKQVKAYLNKPLKLGPLATTEFLVEQGDTSGGSGANFVVKWSANAEVTDPVIEAVMIDTKQQQGISFARSGVVIE